MERRDTLRRDGDRPLVIRATLAAGGALRSAFAAVLVGAVLTSVLAPFAGGRRRHSASVTRPWSGRRARA